MSAPIGTSRRFSAAAVQAAHDMKPRIGADRAIRVRPIRRRPSGPAEPRALAEPHRLDLAGGNGELHVPIEFVAELQKDRVGDSPGEIAVGKETQVLIEILDEDADAELVRDAEDRGADKEIAAERALRHAEPRALGPVQRQPRANEFVDLDLDIEQAGDHPAQARSAFRLGRDQPGKLHLGEIGQGIGAAIRWRADADRRADKGDETVLVRPVLLRDRPRVGPGAEEQGEKTALENVGEARKGVVAIEQPVIGLFGRGQRQSALRTEHAEEAGDEAHAPVALALGGLERGGGELQVRILGDDDIFVGESLGVADARPLGMLALVTAQRVEQVEPPRLGEKALFRLHRSPLLPMRGGQRMISPRSAVRMTVWVKWFTPAYSQKNRSSAAPIRNTPEPS